MIRETNVYADHMTTTTTPKCILNHAPAWSSEVYTCEATATHEWVRPGKTPIPMCAKGNLARRIGFVRPLS